MFTLETFKTSFSLIFCLFLLLFDLLASQNVRAEVILVHFVIKLKLSL
jgi:hypothetical protein